jgi:hypothetical protein
MTRKKPYCSLQDKLHSYLSDLNLMKIGFEPDLMLTLRNKLVHYSAGFRTTSEYPLEKVEEYRKRFAFTQEGTADWTSQVLNLDCVRSGCRTAHAMVQTCLTRSQMCTLF